MGKTSYGGKGPRSCDQAIARGGARQPQGGPQHQAHCPNTGRPKNDSDDRRPSDNDRRLNNNDHCQYSDVRNPVYARIDAEHCWTNPRTCSWTSRTCPTSRTHPPTQQWPSASTRPDPESQTQADVVHLNYELSAANAESNVDPTHILKPTLDPDLKAKPVGSVWNLSTTSSTTTTSRWRKRPPTNSTSSVTTTPNPIDAVQYRYRTLSLAKTWPKLSIVPNSWIVPNQINLVLFFKISLKSKNSCISLTWPLILILRPYLE